MPRRTFPAYAIGALAILLLPGGYPAAAAVVPRLAAGEHLNIVALGTSLTAASFNVDNWFAQTGGWLSAKYPGQVKVSNRAVSGTLSANRPDIDRPHGGFWQLDQALAQDDPDVIFIEFATNDASRVGEMSVADSRKNFKSMIDRVNAWASEHKKNVEIIVLTMNNVGRACDASYRDAGPFFQAWREEATANGLLVIDVYPKWVELYNSESDHATWKSYVPDELHPNRIGTKNIIVPEVQRVLLEHSPGAPSSSAASGKADDGRAIAKPAPTVQAPSNPKLVKLPFAFPRGMENTPVIYKGRPLLVQNYRSPKVDEQESGSYLFIEDLATGQEVARLGTGFSFVSALVNADEMNVFGTVNTNREWTKDVFRFWSTDLKTWKQEQVIVRENKEEHLFNTSVCRDDSGFVMAYEAVSPAYWDGGSPCWHFRFARSKDLSKWEKMPDLDFADVAGKTACGNPTIRHFAPYYYLIYGGWRWKGPGTRYQYLLPTTKYVTFVARSKDLAMWELSPTRAPMLDPTPGEGINNTDADLFEFEGNTYIYYATGEQTVDWGTIRVAMYAGPMKEMLEAYFPSGVPTIKFDAKQRKYVYPQ